MNNTIMLLDDNEITLKNLSTALKMHGYETTSYTDPVEAIDSYSDHQFPIIISDYQMPMINGLETVKILKKLNQKLHCILYTGYPREEILQNIAAAKFKLFLKPFKFAEMLNYLDEIGNGKEIYKGN